MRLAEENSSVEVIVEGKEELERVYRIVGSHGIIQGLQEVLASFKKVGEGSFAQVY